MTKEQYFNRGYEAGKEGKVSIYFQSGRRFFELCIGKTWYEIVDSAEVKKYLEGYACGVRDSAV